MRKLGGFIIETALKDNFRCERQIRGEGINQETSLEVTVTVPLGDGRSKINVRKNLTIKLRERLYLGIGREVMR